MSKNPQWCKMADIQGRDRWESVFRRRIDKLQSHHRRQLMDLLGDPPDPANVPGEFWDRVEREIADEMAAILLLIFIASATQHGLNRDAAERDGVTYAGRGAGLAAEYVSNTRQHLDAQAAKWGGVDDGGQPTPPTKSDVVQSIRTVLTTDRAASIATTETTDAATAGGERAAELVAGLSADDTWFTQNDDRVCPICGPLHRAKRETWSAAIPSGPPAHPNCRCYIHYALEKRGAAAIGESFRLVEHGSHNQKDHGRKGGGGSDWATRGRNREGLNPEAAALVERGKPASPEFLQGINDGTAALPESHKDFLSERGVSIEKPKLSTDDRAELSDVKPRGYTGGSYDEVEAFYDPTTKSVVMAEYARDGDGVRPATNVKGTVAHEMGHAMDDQLGMPSRSDEFQTVWKSEVDAMLADSDSYLSDTGFWIQNDAGAMSYYIQPARGESGGYAPTNAGASEAFAEGYAVAYSTGSSRDSETFKKRFPKTVDKIREIADRGTGG